MDKNITFFDAFSGYGGFSMGIEGAFLNDAPNKSNTKRQTATCVGWSEIDKYAEAVYKYHFVGQKGRKKTIPNFGDITKINPADLPDFDLLTGGIPCQSWSIAGKRGGFQDQRGSMWSEYCRILEAKKPKFFIAENVKGLLSHDGGKSMETICEMLCECGYALDFDVLNAKDFGVPQNRERVFIVGVRLDLLSTFEIF